MQGTIFSDSMVIQNGIPVILEMQQLLPCYSPFQRMHLLGLPKRVTQSLDKRYLFDQSINFGYAKQQIILNSFIKARRMTPKLVRLVLHPRVS